MGKMDFIEFEKYVERNLVDHLSGSLLDAEVKLHEVVKNNGMVKHGLAIKQNNHAIIIYLEDFFNQYSDADDETVLDRILNNISEIALNSKVDQICEINIDIKNVDRIIFNVVNTTRNTEMLKNIPSRSFLDLSVIYRMVVSSNSNFTSSFVITNNYAERMGLTEDDLFQHAAENTLRIYPPVVQTAQSVLMESLKNREIPDDIIEVMLGNTQPDMWVITNTKKIHGSSLILYKNELDKLAMRLGSDLYILPISIHELLAVPSDIGDPQELRMMVATANENEVPKEELLSDNVYYYDRTTGKVRIA